MKSHIRKLTVPAIAAVALAIAAGQATATQKDIVETAIAAGNFTTLAAALEAAGLVDTLKGSGPFTVFAPTDEAFAMLPEGTVDNLLRPENREQLTAVLTHHVTSGKTLALDIARLGAIESLNGTMIDIEINGDRVTVNNAAVVSADVIATNGVIHVLDAVILPPSQ